MVGSLPFPHLCEIFGFFGFFGFSRWFSHVSARDRALPDLGVLGLLGLAWYHLGCLDSKIPLDSQGLCFPSVPWAQSRSLS